MAEPPLLASLPPHFEPSPEARSAVEGGFLILLDLGSGNYFSFNSVAAEVWQRLAGGLPLDRVAASLARDFAVPQERVERDVAGLVAHLAAKGLLRPSRPGAAAGRSRAPAAPPAVERIAAPARRTGWPGVARAWAALVSIDVVLRLGGFRRLLGFLGRAGRSAPAPDEPVAAAISRSVDRAAALYYRKAWCLQRSAACVWLLRRRGFDAKLVLGVRPMPFFAHAWVELGGRVVNDDPERVGQLVVLDRFC